MLLDRSGAGRVSLVGAIVLATSALAMAGPWCSEGTVGWAPADGAHLPSHAHLRFVGETLYYAGKRSSGGGDDGDLDQMPVRATIDGAPVKLSVRITDTGVVTFRDIVVESDKPGALAIELGDPAGTRFTSHYTIDPAWAAPTSIAAVATTRYTHEVVGVRAEDSRVAHGAAIELDAPAIEVTGRWRRDAEDTWRTFQLAAMPVAARPGHAIVEIGEPRCRAATVPVGLLERGIELELIAQLPTGKTLAVSGLPKPLVLAAP